MRPPVRGSPYGSSDHTHTSAGRHGVLSDPCLFPILRAPERTAKTLQARLPPVNFPSPPPRYPLKLKRKRSLKASSDTVLQLRDFL